MFVLVMSKIEFFFTFDSLSKKLSKNCCSNELRDRILKQPEKEIDSFFSNGNLILCSTLDGEYSQAPE